MSHWIYHPEHSAKVVSGDELPNYLENGWYDTPAKFPTSEIKVAGEKIESNVAQALIETLNQQLVEREKEIKSLKAQLKELKTEIKSIKSEKSTEGNEKIENSEQTENKSNK